MLLAVVINSERLGGCVLRPPLSWMLTLYVVLAVAGLPVLMGFAINISTDVLNINDKSKLPSAYFQHFTIY